jgi:predicted nuclease with TOPRIM domain
VLRQHPEIVVRKDNQTAGTELDSLRLQKLENDKKKRSLLNLLNDYDDNLLRSKYAELTKESGTIDRKLIEMTTAINDANNLPHALGNLQELIDDQDSSDLDTFLGSMVAALGDRETRVKLAPIIGSIVKRIDVNLTTLAIRTTFVNGNVDEHQIIH